MVFECSLNGVRTACDIGHVAFEDGTQGLFQFGMHADELAAGESYLSGKSSYIVSAHLNLLAALYLRSIQTFATERPYILHSHETIIVLSGIGYGTFNNDTAVRGQMTGDAPAQDTPACTG